MHSSPMLWISKSLLEAIVMWLLVTKILNMCSTKRHNSIVRWWWSIMSYDRKEGITKTLNSLHTKILTALLLRNYFFNIQVNNILLTSTKKDSIGEKIHEHFLCYLPDQYNMFGCFTNQSNKPVKLRLNKYSYHVQAQT